jgi:SAM-dependent methyltransferase
VAGHNRRHFDFPAYLEAKFAIDSLSLNAALNARFSNCLRSFANPRILDLGTGTGAMLRRILELDGAGNLELMGLDQEEQNLAAGLDRVEQTLRTRGYAVAETRRSGAVKSIRGVGEGREIRVELRRGDLLDRRTTDGLQRFHCITAHAFMDLMPLQPALAIIRGLLETDGVFYPTLNYDGLTVLLPEYEKPGFERRLLRIYNRSMEKRRVRGRKTGGALSGRRLYRALAEGGFRIIGAGPSDWNLFPSEGAYSAEQELFLTAILSFVETEARGFAEASAAGKGALDPQLLEAWYTDRIGAVRNHSLGLIVHQLDLLAKPSPGTKGGSRV